ncbi:hypothetical protein CsatB_006615 [Cannabis sativa]|uniref:Uncharacterized protein n=1 Tax=Cannabis sativa TaxID=3483 RepID=A0A7J6G2H1_CANSA|nr:hypothetical protein G4B88_009178 [Cannabis sativa]
MELSSSCSFIQEAIRDLLKCLGIESHNKSHNQDHPLINNDEDDDHKSSTKNDQDHNNRVVITTRAANRKPGFTRGSGGKHF